MLGAALALSACGDVPSAEPRLPDVEYQSAVRRGCLATRQAAPTTAAPAIQLRDAADAASALRRDFARLRPPARYANAHREAVRLGQAQERLIRAALHRTRRGDAAGALADLNTRNRRLLRRANRIAEALGVRECVRDLDGS